MTTSDITTGEAKEGESWLSSEQSLLALVLIATAIANQYGFWHAFHIAILEHIGIADLPRLAVWPLISGLAFIVLGFILGAWVVPLPSDQLGGVRARTKVANIALKHRAIIGVLLVCTGLFLAFSLEPRSAARNSPILIGLGISALFSSNIRVPEINLTISPFVLSWMVIVLGAAYGNGVASAVDIFRGKEYLKASFPHQLNESLRYLARVGDHVLFYDPAKKAAVLFELKDVEPLTLTPVTGDSRGTN